MDFVRFPHTPHLAWLGDGQPRDDKLLGPALAQSLLANPVAVEEKIDGANMGFSLTLDGDLRVQNRGTWLTPSTSHAQFRPLWDWLAYRQQALIDALWPNLMLFGEWCYALHSVPYDRLPDWFLGFDVFDREAAGFWGTVRRDELIQQLGLHSVPALDVGLHTVHSLRGLMGTSRVGTAPMEGIVIRQTAEGWTQRRAKLVRREFVQAIDTHWSRQRVVRNRLLIENSASTDLSAHKNEAHHNPSES